MPKAKCYSAKAPGALGWNDRYSLALKTDSQRPDLEREVRRDRSVVIWHDGWFLHDAFRVALRNYGVWHLPLLCACRSSASNGMSASGKIEWRGPISGVGRQHLFDRRLRNDRNRGIAAVGSGKFYGRKGPTPACRDVVMMRRCPVVSSRWAL
jgi:hypothetical protein